MNERLSLNDSLQTAAAKLCEGNPGAMSAIVNMSAIAPEVDPQNFAGSFGPLMHLDSCGIYGSGIYVLWNDLCNCDSKLAIAVLRATQLGIVNKDTLREGCLKHDRSIKTMIDPNEVYQQVKSRLSLFA